MTTIRLNPITEQVALVELDGQVIGRTIAREGDRFEGSTTSDGENFNAILDAVHDTQDDAAAAVLRAHQAMTPREIEVD